MAPRLIVLGVVALITISITGMIVSARSVRAALKVSFTILSLSILAWQVSIYLADTLPANKIALNNFVFVWPPIAVYAANYFVMILDDPDGSLKKILRRGMSTLLLATLFFVSSIALSFSQQIIISITGTTEKGLEFIRGAAYVPYLTVLVLSFVLVIFEMYRSYRQSANDSVRHQSFKVVLITLISTAAVGVFTNVILPAFGLNSLATNIGVLASLVFSAGLGLSVLRYRFLDIKPVVARLVAYVASLGIIIVGYALVEILLIQLVFGEKISLQSQLLLAIATAALALTFVPIRRFFDKISNGVFYRDAYNSQEVINTINSTLVTTRQLEDLLTKTASVIEKQLKVSYSDFYLDPRASIEFHLAGSNTKLFGSPHWSEFANLFSEAHVKIVQIGDAELSEEIADLMSELEIECAIKMTSSGDNVGFLMVGPRKSGNAFSGQDVQLLEIIADEVAIAVQNALRFEEITKFNVTLQKKIDEATSELQKSNDKLLALDEAKDEFISMASHQLRTPLTSVKGYISMILEGDAGEVNDTQRKFLDQAFVSSQRMVYLIADLLNVSRLKTGKFVIETKPTYLPDVVESEISQLYETAKARDLTLVFDKPSSFPTLNLDETKIRQVIMNFADNAIYYTPHGGRIVIALKQTAGSVEFTVKDNGIGVPKSEQHHLFTKFYRAGNAKKARPDGTGLGLFMAKKVVVAQGGAIIFETAEGKGSTFGFSFPLEKLQVPAGS